MQEYLTRKVRRMQFFARSAGRSFAPASHYQHRLDHVFASMQRKPDPAIIERVNYYNRLDWPFMLGDGARKASSLSRDEVGSFYYYDFKEFLDYFPPNLFLHWLLGDNILIPEHPAFVKSRPIDPDNQNAVVLKLDKLRHYALYKFRDKRSFEEKKNRAVWRGILNNPKRVALVERYGGSTRHDIAYVDKPRLECSLAPGRPLNVARQLKYRYVISVEGYDVATNLKWIFASRSLCMMPRPRYETWFMEGSLEAGVHYVELRDDFADLEDKIEWYEKNPAEAEAIVDNANRHSKQFTDQRREALISLLVLEKYFELSGQRGPQGFSQGYFNFG